MYGLTLTTPPTIEPVTVAQLKNQLRLGNSIEDTTVLPMYITSARMAFEAWTGRAICPQTYTLYLDNWTQWSYFYQFWTMGINYYPGMFPNVFTARPMQLPISPVTAVNWIKYYDNNNTLQTWSTSNYVVDLTREPARILLLNFPSLNYQTIPRIQVQFVAGYSSVPVDLQHGILLLAADYFRAREATSEFNLKEIPFAFRGIINRYKIWEVGAYGLV